MASAPDRRTLIRLDLALLALLALHGLDHELRHPVATPAVVSALGTVEFVIVIGALWLALRGSPAAWRATSFAGFAVATAYAVVHLPPDWGALSQPYSEIGVDALSWADLALTIVAGVAIGIAARPRTHTTTSEAPWRSTAK